MDSESGDGLILVVPLVIAGSITIYAVPGETGELLAKIVGTLFAWSYFIHHTIKHHATPGKKAMGIMVISDASDELTLGQVIRRVTIDKIISGLLLDLGYVMAGFTKRKQALHDKMASTLVIYRNPEKKSKKTVIIAMVLFFILLAVGGLLSTIVLTSLNSARWKAADSSVRYSLSSILPSMMLHEDEHDTYEDYESTLAFTCGDKAVQPITNISKDGGQMAIFVESCTVEGKYFCANPETMFVSEAADVSESYVRSGATKCNASDTYSGNDR